MLTCCLEEWFILCCDGDNIDNNGDHDGDNKDDNDADDNDDDDPVACDANDLLLGGLISPLPWCW